MSRALRETETETESDRFSINRKPTNGRFLKDRFLVFPILVSLGFKPDFFHVILEFLLLLLTDFYTY
jgi:hypothetical protein